MRVTITKATGVYSQYGILMPQGTINTVGDDFGKSLVFANQASDTDGVLAVTPNRPYQNSPSSLPGTFTFATLPAATAYAANTEAYTSDQGQVVSNGSTWIKQGGITNLQAQRAANIAAHLNGPQVIAPLWVTATVYVAGNVVTITGGQHLVCSVGGTSGGAMPVYTSAVLTGRPLVDNTVTWYGLPWVKSANDVNAPVITSGASAAAVGLVETAFNVGGVVIPQVTPFSSRQKNNGNAAVRHYQFANGPSTGAGNSTADATSDGQSAANVYQTHMWDMEFYVTDAKFGIVAHNSSSPIYVEVDGVMVQGNPLPSSGASGWCLAFDYNGVVKRRLVRVSDVQVGAQIRGVAMTVVGILEPSDSPNDCMLLLGDSLQNTVVPSLTTPMPAMQGFWLKRLLGLSSVVNATVGGTGYVTFGANTYTVPALITNPANQALITAYAPSHVMISAGYNDSALSFGAVGPAALASWQSTRALLPNAKITIVDGFSEAKGPDAATLTQAANLLALFNSWNDSNSRFVQAVGPTASTAWTQGTGNAGAALAAGNASNYVSTDTAHPTPAGAYYLAQRMANAIKAAWNNAY